MKKNRTEKYLQIIEDYCKKEHSTKDAFEKCLVNHGLDSLLATGRINLKESDFYVMFKRYPKEILRTSTDIIKPIAFCKSCASLPHFDQIFVHANATVRANLACNPSAQKFSQYKNLFIDKSPYVQKNVFQCADTKLFEKEFDSIIDNGSKIEVEEVAMSLNAAKSKGYAKLFQHEDEWVIAHIAANEKAAELYPNEYRKLFAIPKYQKFIALNKNAPNFPEYKQLFEKGSNDTLTYIAKNNAASKRFPNEFRQLFKYVDEKIQLALTSSQYAKFPEFKTLFDSPFVEVRRNLAENSRLVKIPKFATLFDDPDLRVRRLLAANEGAVNLPQFAAMFDEKIAQKARDDHQSGESIYVSMLCGNNAAQKKFATQWMKYCFGVDY